MAGLFGIGTSALDTARLQIEVTGHNIANATTPGYSRQVASQATAGSNLSGSGFVGRGVQVTNVQRRWDGFLAREISAHASAAAAETTRSGQLAQLDQLFSDPDTGVGAAYDQFTAALGDLASRPMDTSARGVALERANRLAERVRTFSSSLDTMRSASEARIGDEVTTLRGSLGELARINERIGQLSGVSHPPNDLLDQRDALIERVNGTLRAQSVVHEDGTVSLFTAGGDPLLTGSHAASLVAAPDPADPTRIRLALDTPGGTVALAQGDLGGGSLAGLMRFRDDDLAAVAGRLDRIAVGIASAYGRQQALGVDAAGRDGLPLFTSGPLSVVAAPGNGTGAGGTNPARVGVAIADPAALQPSDYSLEWSGSAWAVTRASDGAVTHASSLPATVDGLAITLDAGTPAAGDRFTLKVASGFASGLRASLTDPQRLATGLAMASEHATGNRGDLATAAFEVASADPALRPPVTLTFDGAGGVTVSGSAADGRRSYAAGTAIAVDGWSLTLTGTPAAGDVVTVSPTRAPGADNRNALKLAALGDAPVADGMRVTDALASLVGDVGMRVQGAEAGRTASEGLLATANRQRAEVSGVNLDEEAARLMQFQQAYMAGTKVITAAQSMFEALLQAANR